MHRSNHFNFSRFWSYLKMELFRSRKGIWMVFGISFGTLFILGLILTPFIEQDMTIYDHNDGYTFHILIGGFVLSSLTFRDLGNSLKRYRYLTLPVSALEKFLCMWFLTTICWVIVYTIAYYCFTLIATPIGKLLFSPLKFTNFNPFSGIALSAIKYYLVIQGIFMVGATHFKGYILPKTVLTVIAAGLACGIIFVLFLSDLFIAEHDCAGYECEHLSTIGENKFWSIIKWIFWWALAPVCWIITYQGLKEKEA